MYMFHSVDTVKTSIKRMLHILYRSLKLLKDIKGSKTENPNFFIILSALSATKTVTAAAAEGGNNTYRSLITISKCFQSLLVLPTGLIEWFPPTTTTTMSLVDRDSSR